MEDMKKSVKKGGIDTIIAYVVVAIPLFYVLVFMIATLFHFAVQMHVNQVVKEVLIMASSYGKLTDDMVEWLDGQLENFGGDNGWTITVAKRPLQEDGSIGDYDPNVGGVVGRDADGGFADIKKGDLLVMEVRSNDPSVLGTVSNFALFDEAGTNNLFYSALREEIIRNDPPT